MAADWVGSWNTLWATGSVLLTLEQQGSLLHGVYEPGNGRVKAWVVDGKLKGRWYQDGAEGQLEFVMSRDRQSFAGRYDGDRYWNGERTGAASSSPLKWGATATPQGSLRALLRGMNATRAGDLSATIIWEKLLVYAGTDDNARTLMQRRELLWQILDMSTLRLSAAPEDVQVASDWQTSGQAVETDSAALTDQSMRISAAGVDVSYELRFNKGKDGRWRIVVDELEDLESVHQAYLEAVGASSYAIRVLQRTHSPRETLRRFVQLTTQTKKPDVQELLEYLDLDFLPPSLRKLEAPLYADYLSQVLRRSGEIIWQEVPDNPSQLEPFLLYSHPAGSIVIGSLIIASAAEETPATLQATSVLEQVSDELDIRWRFSQDTMREANVLFDAVNTLPVSPGFVAVEPFSEFFLLRERFNKISPVLTKRSIFLENWQWLALVMVLVSALIVAALLVRIMRGLLRITGAIPSVDRRQRYAPTAKPAIAAQAALRMNPGEGVRNNTALQDRTVQTTSNLTDDEENTVKAALEAHEKRLAEEAEEAERSKRALSVKSERAMAFSVYMAVLGAVGFFSVGKLGLPDGIAIFMGTLAAITATLGIGSLALQGVRLMGHYLSSRAAKSSTYMDEIVASLVTGLLSLVIIFMTVIAVADIFGLPYEGVIAGLGVGGIAIAIAAKETVSNFIGAATLLADRPFKRGDIIDTAGIRARVLDVGLRSTKMRQHDDSIILVPNFMLANQTISNRGMRTRRQIHLIIGLTYDTPRHKLDEFVENLKQTWLSQPTADQGEHYIGLKTFGASSIDIVMWGYAIVRDRREQYEAEHRFVGDIVDCARLTGVSFAFPTRTLHMVNEEPDLIDPDDVESLEPNSRQVAT